MVGYLRALATDFDGTLSNDGMRPGEDVLAALAHLREQDRRILLVTGRILSELQAVFPDVGDHVDAIVAENGCVLHTDLDHRLLATPVDERLIKRLRERGVDVRAGEVLQACRAQERIAVLEEIHGLELDCQLVFNRSELMILPSGVNKGTGLYEALGDLGISRHSALGVGDAENDRALLDVCEVGVAVADSVESLLEFADLVAPEPDGEGIIRLVGDLLRPDSPPIHSRRWQIRLGAAPDGATASVPSSQMNILVTGEPGSGKSHLTGLMAERLIAQGYCVLVIDPEGDHQGLGRLRGVQVIDGHDGLPTPQRVARIFSQRYTSVVLDLSQVPEHERCDYLERLSLAVQRSRASVGLPHWIIADEAHSTIGAIPPAGVREPDQPGPWGYCLATYRPDLIEQSALARMDAIVLMGSGDPPGDDRLALLAIADQEAPGRVEAEGMAVGTACLAVRPGLGCSTRFRVASRVTEHHRHWHKYVDSFLPGHRRFYFRDGADTLIATAANLRDFQAVLGACRADVIAHHCEGNDFSRWLDEVFSDLYVASQLGDIEGQVVAGEITSDEARERIVACVGRSYGVG